jgi:hypothetical protein
MLCVEVGSVVVRREAAQALKTFSSLVAEATSRAATRGIVIALRAPRVGYNRRREETACTAPS